MISNMNSLIDSISKDHQRGASEIVENIAELYIAITKIGLKEPEAADQLFSRGVRILARGQPTMAPVLNFLNKVCLARSRLGDNWSELAREITQLHEKGKSQLDAMLARIDELPRIDGVLMTFSNSSTAAQIIIACQHLNFPSKVICSEGRPVMEGLVMARRLTSNGVSVTVYTDAALMSKIIDVDAVWVGGDSLSHNGLVNKVGSRALAILAKAHNIPFISLMSSDKLMSPNLYPFFRCLPQNPREIASDDADELDVINEYYEQIPLDMVDYIFTEKGLSKPEELLEDIREEAVCEKFQQLVLDND